MTNKIKSKDNFRVAKPSKNVIKHPKKTLEYFYGMPYLNYTSLDIVLFKPEIIRTVNRHFKLGGFLNRSFSLIRHTWRLVLFVNLGILELYYRFQTLVDDFWNIMVQFRKLSNSMIVNVKSIRPFKTCWFFTFLQQIFCVI